MAIGYFACQTGSQQRTIKKILNYPHSTFCGLNPGMANMSVDTIHNTLIGYQEIQNTYIDRVSGDTIHDTLKGCEKIL